MYFDGSLMKKGIDVGLVFVSSLRVCMKYMVRLHFPASNNVVEYEALMNGLRIAIELGIRRLDIQGDSQLVIDQVMKELSCHNAKMATYCQEVRQLEDKFDGLELNHIPRRLNEATDALAKATSGRELVPTGDEDIAKMESRTTPIQEGEDDEDIATLVTPTLWSSPSCNLSPTQLPRHPRIQQTRRHSFGHNFLIRHRNGAFLDALERG
jgi:ribonuclease HI